MLLTRADGFVQKTPQDAQQLEAAGYVHCYTSNWKKIQGQVVPCPFWLSPESVEAVKDKGGGYYTCPVCMRSHDLLHEMPWHGVDEEEAEANYRQDFAAGGSTRIGLLMTDQAQIGEDLVQGLGELPGYGPITWWHSGQANTPSPLDGATKDWGIEVKTIGYDATHHRFVPGRAQEKLDKNEMAEQMGKKGILGVLVLLDYRRSVADIYVREMPLGGGPAVGGGGPASTGVLAFRSSAGMHLVKEVPFKNPLMDPASPSPVTSQPGGFGGNYNAQGEEMPF